MTDQALPGTPPAVTDGAPHSDAVGAPVLRARAQRLWEATTPVRSAAARYLAVVSPLGWLFLAVAAISALVGYRYNWIELWVPALAITLSLMVATIFVIGRASYRITVDLAANRVVVGTRASGAVTVANAGSRSLLPSRIELPVGRGMAAFRVPRLGADDEHEELFMIPTSRRGVVQVGPVLSVRDDPLRLLRREVRWTDPQDLYVHPRTVNLDGSSSGFLRDVEGLPTRDLSASDVSFHALREYAPGDDRRSIHWRTTARTGRLMVRQYEETRRSHLVVALSAHGGDYASPEEFELAVSTAASLALQAIREEKQVTVLTQSGKVPAATGQRLLDGMSGVEISEESVGVVDLARVASATVPGASVLAVVGGDPVPPATWQRVSAQVPLGTLGFAVAASLDSQVSRKSIGSFPVVVLGQLGDLPRVMRRLEA